MTARRVINKFNRGEVSPLALARDDVRDITDTCELMENFLPIRLGPMRFRPGFEYIGDAYSPASDTNRALLPLTRSIGDSIQFEFSGSTMRPLVDGLPLSCSADTTGLANGDFSGGLTSWTQIGTPVAGGGKIFMLADEGLYQASTTIAIGEKQTFRITVEENPVHIYIGDGAAAYAEDYHNAFLYPGVHFLQFTPTTTQFVITIINHNKDLWYDPTDPPGSYVTECIGLTTGEIQFTFIDTDMRTKSFDSSADVMFLAMGSEQKPRVLKRRGVDSYSLEDYLFHSGPYLSVNTSETHLDTTSIAIGENTTTAVAVSPGASNIFDASRDIGRLIKAHDREFNASTNFTSTGVLQGVGVRGYGSDRDIFIVISGTFTATISLERLVSGYPTTGTWEVVRTFVSPTTTTFNDLFGDTLNYYRLNCSAYTSGNAYAEILHVSSLTNYEGKIHTVTNATQVDGWSYRSSIYLPFNDKLDWWMGAWYVGAYPQGVTFFEGRLCWASKNRIDMSVTDDYFSFDADIPGDSAAITRTIGFGSVENISWLESGGRLFLGLPTTEVLVRSNNFDEPLTALNTNLRPGKGVGSKAVRAAPDEDDIYFVSRDGKRAHRLNHTVTDDRQLAEDLMVLHPDICSDGIAAIVITKHPEKRVWILTETGELRVLIKDQAEDIQAWSRVIVDGVVEDIQVVPQSGEDELWAIIRRNGNSRLYKMTQFSEIAPVDFCKRYTSPGTATLTGLSHLEGETVHVWADNQFLPNTYTVSSGQITIDSTAYTTVFVGKQITAKYKSNKLGQYVSDSVIGERKRVVNTALVMRDYSPGTLKVGRDFNHLRDLPNAVAGTLVTDYDEQKVSFGGTLDTDSRICLQATGPCTVMALAYSVNTSVNQSGGQN